MEQKILLNWKALSIPFPTFKTPTLGFCRFLKGSYSKKFAKHRARALFIRNIADLFKINYSLQ